MAHDVFISYSSADKTVADGVCALLEGRGIRCWIAPRDVTPGVPYAESISSALHEVKVLVLVLSDNANQSSHIPREVEQAASYGKTIIPFRIEDVAPARSLEYFIRSIHWLDAITPPLAKHIEALADTISRFLGNSSEAAPPISRRPISVKGGSSPRRRWAVMALAAILLSVATGWAIVASRDSETTQTKAKVAAPTKSAKHLKTSTSTTSAAHATSADSPNAGAEPKPAAASKGTDQDLKPAGVPEAVSLAARRIAPDVNFTLLERANEKSGVFYQLQGKLADDRRIEFHSDEAGKNYAVYVDIAREKLPKPIGELLDEGLADLKVERIQAAGVTVEQPLKYVITGVRRGERIKLYSSPNAQSITANDKEYRVYEIPLDSVPKEAREAADAAQPDVKWETAERKREGDLQVIHLYGINGQGHKTHVAYANGTTVFFTTIPEELAPPEVRNAVRQAYPEFKPGLVIAGGQNGPAVLYYEFTGMAGDQRLRLLVPPDGKRVINKTE